METHGKILQRLVKLDKRKAQIIADLVGVRRQTLYEWMKEEKLTLDQLDLLKKAGIDIVKNEGHLSESSSINVALDTIIGELRSEIGHLRIEHNKLASQVATLERLLFSKTSL